jgi:hypothetical protein
MTMQSTSIVLLLAVALGAGVLERDRIWPSSGVAPKEAIKPPPPLPPVRPDADATTPVAPAPTVVAAVSPVAPPAVVAMSPVAPPAVAAVARPVPPTPPARMTLAQQADFDSWMVKTYLGCWKPAPQPADADNYVAKVRLAFKPDGSLKKPPKLVNPPSDPAAKPQAKSVMQAVRACNPLPVPAQYRPFYEQWKTKTVHFNPQFAAR